MMHRVRAGLRLAIGEAVQGDTPTGVSPTPLFKQRSYRIQLHRLPIRVSESENWSTEARVMMMI